MARELGGALGALMVLAVLVWQGRRSQGPSAALPPASIPALPLTLRTVSAAV